MHVRFKVLPLNAKVGLLEHCLSRMPGLEAQLSWTRVKFPGSEQSPDACFDTPRLMGDPMHYGLKTCCEQAMQTEIVSLEQATCKNCRWCCLQVSSLRFQVKFSYPKPLKQHSGQNSPNDVTSIRDYRCNDKTRSHVCLSKYSCANPVGTHRETFLA